MKKIYSKVNPSQLLHVFFSKSDFNGRVDLSDSKEFLQLSSMVLPEGKKVLPHKHLSQQRTSSITQEALIVIEGSIEVTYYDTDNSLLEVVLLNAGDSTITFAGGHSFTIKENNTKVYEVKNGPYLGKEYDYQPF